MRTNPSPSTRSRLNPLGAGLVVGVLALTSLAHAEDLDLPVKGRDVMSTAISPANDVDAYTIHLFAGDTLKAKMVQTGPNRGLNGHLELLLPDGNDSGVFVKNQDRRNPQFNFEATVTGEYTVRASGDTGGQAGSQGNYKLTLKAKRAKPAKDTFADPAGGTLAYRFNATADAQVNVTLKTKKGGLDVTELVRPDDTPEPDFLGQVKAKANRRSAKAKKFRVTGGTGAYELRAAYDAGSAVAVKVKVIHDEKKRKRQLDDFEPGFDRLIPPFPSTGIVGTELNVTGRNFDFDPGEVDENGRNVSPDDDVFPRCWIGDVEVPQSSMSFNGSVFRFPVPAGVVAGQTYDMRVMNFDGQGSRIEDAFTHAELAVVVGLSETEGGPAGGRNVRITGRDFHRDSIVLFGNLIVQPTRVRDTTIDVVSPPNDPGVVDVTVRDVFGQSSVLADAFTYLDVGSNRITSVAPTDLQGIGGETVTVTGEDFTGDSTFTLNDRPVDVDLVSETEVTFVAPALADGDVELRVQDSLEQSSTADLTAAGFEDRSVQSIPTPHTVAGALDGWRATTLLSGLVDDDDILDLVLLRPEEAFGDDIDRSRMRLLLGDGAGGFTDATETNFPGTSALDDHRGSSATFFDLEGDGDLDIAFITPSLLDDGDRSSLRIWENDGDGVFTDVTATSAPDVTDYGDSNQGVMVAAGDADGIGGDDLFILHTDFFTKITIIPPPPPDPMDPEPGEDTIITEYFAGLRILLNDGDGVLTRAVDVLPEIDADDPTQYQGDSLAVDDVDGDGFPDVILSRDRVIEFPEDSGTFILTASLLLNDGAGVFTDESATMLPEKSDPDYLQADQLQLVDMNGDGELDLLCVSNTRFVSPVTSNLVDRSVVRYFENDGDGNFAAPDEDPFPASDGLDNNQAEAVGVGDLTGDGKVDLVLVSTSPPNIGEQAARPLVAIDGGLQRGSEGFPGPPLGDNGRGAAVVLIDVDGDGDLDVVIARDEANEAVRNTRVLVNPRL